MTTPNVTTSDVPVPAASPRVPPPGRPRAGQAGPAEDRGDLTIAGQVVEKIAATALAEVDQIGGAARRVLGVSLGAEDPDRLPQVTAQITGSVVTVQARCSVVYPAPIARITDQARAHLIDRVEELTGLTARQVDITVTALSTASISTNRRELQ